MGGVLWASKNTQDRPEFVDSDVSHRRVNVGDLLADVHPVGRSEEDADLGNGADLIFVQSLPGLTTAEP